MNFLEAIEKKFKSFRKRRKKLVCIYETIGNEVVISNNANFSKEKYKKYDMLEGGGKCNSIIPSTIKF